jgi:7,8-dihydropterin-6-yl-methyl-4-(beta-D-ribofuranosyl)aminobenzene 5'-phosphate synthase
MQAKKQQRVKEESCEFFLYKAIMQAKKQQRVKMGMKIKVLAENTVYKRGYLGEHGLSLWMETKEKQYLFDMGQSGVFLQNADKMNLNLEQLDGIILSHGHYDHCGGMLAWARKHKSCENPSGIPIYINRRAFDRKYSKHPVTGDLLFSGIQEDAEKWMKESGNLICTSEGRSEVTEDVYLLSKIPYATDFEAVPARFLKEVRSEMYQNEEEPGNEYQQPENLEKEKTNQSHLAADTMEDEQLLVIREDQGLCVFAGCAHPGMINCLNYVRSSFPGEHIHSLVAGMHLKGCRAKQLKLTIESLQEMDIDRIVPLHCTGMLAIAAIKEAMGDKCLLAEVGKTIVL